MKIATNHMEYLRRAGDSKAMHVSNYAYAIDLSESHIVMYKVMSGALRVYEAEVLCCRTPIDDIDRKFYIPDNIVNALKTYNVVPYWGRTGLPWVDNDFAKYIMVREEGGKLFVFLSHVDYESL